MVGKKKLKAVNNLYSINKQLHRQGASKCWLKTKTYIYYVLSKFLDTLQQPHCCCTVLFMTQLQQVAHCPTKARSLPAVAFRLALAAKLCGPTPTMARCNATRSFVSTQSCGFSRRQHQNLICWIAVYLSFIYFRHVCCRYWAIRFRIE